MITEEREQMLVEQFCRRNVRSQTVLACPEIIYKRVGNAGKTAPLWAHNASYLRLLLTVVYMYFVYSARFMIEHTNGTA